MADITIAFTPAQLRGDFVLGADDLTTGNDLATSVLVSLFTDPGWWANAYEPGDWGCRLLELKAAARTEQTRLRARDYIRKALAWMIEDKAARSVDVTTAWQGSLLLATIVITQATGVTRYSFEWAGV